MFGRSAAHRAMTPQQVSPPLEVAWHFQTDDQVVASPVVRDHLAYVGSRDKKLYAIDTGKGSARWSFLAGDRLEGAAAVTEDLVCVGALSGSVYGVDVDGRAVVGTGFFVLFGVLWVKAGLEERWMAAQHPGYAAYQAGTARFVPWLL